MRAQFWQLYKKELKEISTFSMAYGVLSIGWFVFLMVMRGWWHLELVFGLSFIPLGLLPFYVMAQGFFSFRGEWKSDSIYTVLALPLPGWYFTTSKLLATMTSFTALSFLSILGVYIVGNPFIQAGFASVPTGVGMLWFWKMAIGVYIFFWMMSALVYAVSQFSYLISRLVNRLSGLVAGITVIVSYCFLLRVGGWLAVLLGWFPGYKIDVWNYVNGMYHTQVILIPLAPWVGLVLLSAGLSYAGAWILEHILEV